MANIVERGRYDQWSMFCYKTRLTNIQINASQKNTHFASQDTNVFYAASPPYISHRLRLFLRGSEFASTTTCGEGLPETDYVSGRMSRV